MIERQAAERDVGYETVKRAVFTEDAALDRLVEPNDIANLIPYLASEKGRHITGQDINVDAGTIWD